MTIYTKFLVQRDGDDDIFEDDDVRLSLLMTYESLPFKLPSTVHPPAVARTYKSYRPSTVSRLKLKVR